MDISKEACHIQYLVIFISAGGGDEGDGGEAAGEKACDACSCDLF